MHSPKNTYEDVFPILHISAGVNPKEYGKHPLHEIKFKIFYNVFERDVAVKNDVVH